MSDSRRQHQAAGPRLERVQNDHRPVEQRAEALETENEVQGETVGRPGRDPETVGELRVPEFVHRAPDPVARVADRIGIVEEQQVEFIGLAALERLLGGRSQIVAILLRLVGRGEARIALCALTIAPVKVVPDRTDETEGISRQTGEGPPEH